MVFPKGRLVIGINDMHFKKSILQERQISSTERGVQPCFKLVYCVLRSALKICLFCSLATKECEDYVFKGIESLKNFKTHKNTVQQNSWKNSCSWAGLYFRKGLINGYGIRGPFPSNLTGPKLHFKSKFQEK